MNPVTSDAVLSVRTLTKEFTNPEGTVFTALGGVDLEIMPGEFFILLGPSGCGKTTLLRSIAGLEQPTGGEIWLGEERIDELPPFKRKVNTVFQAYALFPHLTVRENISFGLEMEGKSPRSAEVQTRVSEMLELVGLGEFGKRKPHQLSGGQQQRVALARALAKRPSVLLLDEPLSALDLKLRREMRAELKRIQVDAGITFVFVTHDQEEAMSMGDRIAVLNKGTIAQLGSPRELYGSPVNRFVAEFIGEMNFLTATGNADGAMTAGGTHLPAAAMIEPIPEGESVTVGVRPEHLRAVDRGPINGRIVAVQFLGTDVRLCLRLGGDEEVWARVSLDYEGPTALGSEVSLAPTERSVRVVRP